ncbi:glycosyltransferase family 2 protein [Lactiplantibacillus plantarum]|uniref:glycosyltransferase family 2 protein n=1 Tax=Lactiplantibacillus plantarum TaxID=1590 RepID=UPI0007BADCF2|nr:glycosyltransferase family 2 protein [Lactiplantibacillus plantarum]KZU06111.1 putative glycosyl transferase [Lactiplantibacillus plantarum]KZU86359.1 putative glycosyl transferase [Lactiplantibacillus plantarum]MCW6151806.1 glycosyltransferase [Lactiplantibacillus plantarum]
MNRIEVSIILPVYNSQKFICETINSVLSQSFKLFELLIINDASTDDTEKIIQSYNDPRIVYKKFSRNRGVANARNYGINLAEGEFVAFIDSDDIWNSDKLQQQLQEMQAKCINFSYSNYELVNESGRTIKYIENLPKWNTYKSLLMTNSIPLLTVIIKKNLIKGNQFINIRHEDYATWLQILRKSDEKAWLFPEITAKYRVRDDSISSNKLKSLSWTWNVYRNSEHLSLIKSAYYLGCNALHGLLKHQQIFKSV